MPQGGLDMVERVHHIRREIIARGVSQEARSKDQITVTRRIREDVARVDQFAD